MGPYRSLNCETKYTCEKLTSQNHIFTKITRIIFDVPNLKKWITSNGVARSRLQCS